MIAFSATGLSLLARQRTMAPRAHMIGVLGSGMQAIAAVLLARGWRLSGSDTNPAGAAWLRRAGANLHSGHAADRLGGQDLVIYSEAIPADNPERREAARRGIPQLSYPQILGELMTASRGLAIAGTHGKSTTTAMIGAIMSVAGRDPTIICGATPHGTEHGGRAGSDEWLVAEACEYRQNFLALRPEIATILNIEADHFDCYDSLADIELAFHRFIDRLRSGGELVASADCPLAQRVAALSGRRVTTFGLRAKADWKAVNLAEQAGYFRFELEYRGTALGPVELRVPGQHHVANALAAAANCYLTGLEPVDICRGLTTFRGLRRRLERVGCHHGVEYWDDYAHHPTEIRAALRAMRAMFSGRRLWCIFQPHQVSRTLALVDEFTSSLQNACRVAVADVFVAREVATQDPRRVAENLACRVRVSGTEVLPETGVEPIADLVRVAAQPGDVVITLGAGDIRKRFYERIDGL